MYRFDYPKWFDLILFDHLICFGSLAYSFLAPVIESIEPSSGPIPGGTSVNITQVLFLCTSL
jgi:hypothetical protein